MGGGTLAVNTNAFIGNASNGIPGTGGTFNHTAGTVTIGTGTGLGTTNANTNNGIGNLTLGVNSGDTGTYNLSGSGALIVYSNASFFNAGIELGEAGTGTFMQTGGTINTYGANGMAIGDCVACGGSGAYTISAGTLTVNPNVNVSGQSGNVFVSAHEDGTMTQSGGSVSIAANLFVGYDNQSGGTTGTYTLGGDGTLIIGAGNNGGQGGDTGDLNIGTQSTGNGIFNYNIASGDAGTLSFAGAGSGQSLVVGDSGTGVFNEGSASNPTDLNLQTSGTTLDIGRSLGGHGTFNLAAGSSLEDDMIVGDAGTGTFNNNAGTNTVGTTSLPANLIIGNQSTGNGTYDNNGGSNTINGGLIVGAAGTGFYNLGNGVAGATLNLVGTGLQGDLYVGETGTGTVTASNAAVVTVGSALVLGGPSPGETSGSGTFNLMQGSSLSVAAFTAVGGAGTGVFLNDASTHTTPILVLGQLGTSNGTYTLQDGGSLTVGTSSNPGFFDVAEHGTGTFNQSGATSMTTVNGDLDVGRCAGPGCFGAGDTDNGEGRGTVNLSGGGLSVSTFAVVGDSGSGTFNQVGNSTVTVSNELDIGRFGGTGTYNLGGGISALNIADDPSDASSLTITQGNLVVGGFGPSGTAPLIKRTPQRSTCSPVA